jgi:hypothetical protein
VADLSAVEGNDVETGCHNNQRDSEMLEEAARLAPTVKVARTQESEVDTLGGILGEFAFAEWFTGDWRSAHEVGRNKGRADFRGVVEVKTSVYPFRETLHLVVREDYGGKPKPLYVQLIVSTDAAAKKSIVPGTRAILCGYAYHADVAAAKLLTMPMGGGRFTRYRTFQIPIYSLRPMDGFRTAYEASGGLG